MADEQAEPTTPPPAAPTAATISESDVIKAKKGAARDAQKAIAEQLGMSVEDAKAFIDAKAAADEAAKTEQQRAIDAANQAQQAAIAAQQAAGQEIMALKAERALMSAGVDPSACHRLAPTLGLEPGAEDDQILAAVETLKTELPSLFTGPANKPAAYGGSNLPSHRPPASTPAPPATLLEAGAARAKALSGAAFVNEPPQGI